MTVFLKKSPETVGLGFVTNPIARQLMAEIKVDEMVLLEDREPNDEEARMAQNSIRECLVEKQKRLDKLRDSCQHVMTKQVGTLYACSRCGLLTRAILP